MTYLSVSDLRSYLERIQNDSMPRVSQELFLDFCNDLNQITYEDLLYINPDDYLTTQTYGVVSGTDSYALPSDFTTIACPKAGVWEVNSEGLIVGDSLSHVSDNNDKTGYFIQGSNIVFRPMPTTSKTYKMKYIPELTTLTSQSDFTVIPERLKEYAKYFIRNALYEWYNNPSSEVFNDQKFARARRRFLISTKKAPTTYVLSSF